MGRRTQLERVEITLHRGRVDPGHLHPLHEEVRVVDTLRAGEDLLAAHEEIVRVGQGRVDRVGHGVERSDGERELVEDEVVGVVFFPYQSAEELLVLGAARIRAIFGNRTETVSLQFDSPHVVHLANGVSLAVGRTGLTEHLHSFLERQAQRLLKEEEVVAWELLLDDVDLVRERLFETAENRQEQVVKHIEDLVVVLLDGHLEVETDKLGHVAMGV
jgi:hypothetical protein